MQIRDLIPWGRKAHDVSPRAEDENPIYALQRDINRIFDNFWNRFETPVGAPWSVGTPRTDVVETDKAIEVSMELPGLDEKNIDVTLTRDTLTVKGEKRAEREDRNGGYYLSERSYGSFYRTIPLPPGVSADDAKAEFKKGVLTITLPKTPEAQAEVKKINIKAA